MDPQIAGALIQYIGTILAALIGAFGAAYFILLIAEHQIQSGAAQRTVANIRSTVGKMWLGTVVVAALSALIILLANVNQRQATGTLTAQSTPTNTPVLSISIQPTDTQPPPLTPLSPPVVGDCASRDAWLIAQSSDPASLGTESNPLVYPDNWLGDLCYARAGGGTGAKYIKVQGPTALQMGSPSSFLHMLFVPRGTEFTGWTQGGWRYASDEALLAEWRGAGNGTDGLICGYEQNMKKAVPAYRWDGSKEVPDPSLDCQRGGSHLGARQC